MASQGVILITGDRYYEGDDDKGYRWQITAAKVGNKVIIEDRPLIFGY